MTDIYFIKQNVSHNEYWQHNYSYIMCNQINIPKIIDYTMGKLKMSKIHNMCIADMYGEDWSDIPLHIKVNIHFIISELYKNGIIYPDITGYNFIEFNKKVWVVDFGHAFSAHLTKFTPIQLKHKQFVEKFINEPNNWNLDFK